MTSSADTTNTRGHRRAWLTSVAAVSVTLVAAACSSSGTSTASNTGGASGSVAASPASSGGATGKGATGSALTVMLMGLIQPIPQSTPYTEIPAAAQAAADAVNAVGGINGHPIKLTVCDTKQDQNVASNCARQAVANKDVAVFSQFNVDTFAFIKILSQASIPYYGGYAFSAADATDPDTFPLQGSNIYYPAMVKVLADGGCKTASIVAINVPQIKPIAELGAAAFKADGVKVASTDYIPPTVADWSPYVARWNAKGVQCLLPVIAATAMPQLLAAVHQSPKKITVVTDTPSETTASLKTLGSSAAGLKMVGMGYVPTDTQVPIVAQAVSEIKKYQPNAHLDLESITTWGMARALFKLMQGIQGDVTGASVLKALQGATAFDPQTMGVVDFSKPVDIGGDPRTFETSIISWTIGSNDVPKLDSTQFTKVSS